MFRLNLELDYTLIKYEFKSFCVLFFLIGYFNVVKKLVRFVLKVGETMSIRLRLILSNIAMIIIPIILFILAAMILVFAFFGDPQELRLTFDRTGHYQGMSPVERQFIELKKIAALSPEKLMNISYLSSIAEEFKEKGTILIVRKKDKIIYHSPHVKQLPTEDLPSFGFEESNRPIQRIGNRLFSIQKHDFFYSDGTGGTLFLLQDAEFVKIFFPILFGSLVLVLIVTNGLLSYFVSKSIIKPVHELMMAARKISDGDLRFQIKTTKKDELGQLLQAFEIMRKKLKESIDLQNQYEDNRKELIANISHDLKTPITAIKGYVEGIRDGVANSPEKMDRYTQTIYSKANDMDYLIDELFLYSKLDLKRLPFHFEKIDLRNYLSDYIEELRLDLTKRNITLTLHSSKVESYEVVVDREQLKRVITNIIDNSLKYMDKKKKRIELSLQEKEGTVLMRIQDNGPGIDPEALSLLFDRFYRGDSSRNTETGGSGLGLAIAKRIVEEHGGKIWAESVLGEGTSILFTLKKPEK